MKHAKLILAVIFAFAGFLAIQAYAQTVPTNLWRPNFTSNTITPFNSALKIPCANVVGGCGNFSGTSTANSFSTGTSTANSQITNLNSNLYIPNQAFLTTLGCPGFPSDHTLDTCTNDWYQNNFGIVSSTNFYTAGGLYTWSDPNGFQFTNPGESASVNCIAGRGTRINDNAATGTFAVFANGTNANAGQGIFNCTEIGTTVGTVTAASSTGLLGVVLAAPYTTVSQNFISGFSTDIAFQNNGYIDTIDKSFLQNGGYEIYEPAFSNGGEKITISNSTCSAAGNASTSNAMVFGGNSVVVNADSIDGCGGTVLSGAHVQVIQGHRETVNTATFGAYPVWTVQAGGVLDEKTVTYVQDGTAASSTLANELVLDQPGGIVSEDGVSLYGSPTPNFVAGGGSATYNNIHNEGGVVTSSLTLFNVPSSAGLTGTASGTLVYDTNNNLLATYDASTTAHISDTLFSTALLPWSNGATNASDTLTSAQASNTTAAFQTTYTLPANFLAQNKTLRVSVAFQEKDPSTLTGETITLRFRTPGGVTTTAYSSVSAVGACAATQNCGYGATFLITPSAAVGSSVSTTLSCITCNGGSPATVIFDRNATAQPFSLNTATSEIMEFTTNFTNNSNPATTSLMSLMIEDVN